MIDEQKNSPGGGATVRVPQWVRDEAEAEIKNQGRPRPTLGDLLVDAWRKRKALGKPEPVTPSRLSKRETEAHDLLQYILTNGTAKDVEWIIGNLQNFSEAISGRKKPIRKHGS